MTRTEHIEFQSQFHEADFGIWMRAENFQRRLDADFLDKHLQDRVRLFRAIYPIRQK